MYLINIYTNIYFKKKRKYKDKNKPKYQKKKVKCSWVQLDSRIKSYFQENKIVLEAVFFLCSYKSNTTSWPWVVVINPIKLVDDLHILDHFALAI